MQTKPSANDIYSDRITKARTMLAAISALLDHHEADQKRDPTNWGFPGDLGELNKKLGEAAICITAGGMSMETNPCPVLGSPTAPDLRPRAHVYHGTRQATVLAVDADPTAHVWIVYKDNPDEDAMVHREELSQPCAICERAPASVDAIEGNRLLRVCAACFEYEADGVSS